MNKFKLFRLIDLLTLGGVASAVSGFALYAYFMGIQGEPLALLITVALTMWLGYGTFLYARKKFLDRITFITKHGIGVMTEDFPVDKEEFEKIVNKTISDWTIATEWNGCEKALEGTLVKFKPYPVKLHSKDGALAGYLAGGDVAVIGYLEPLNTTALAHELGHKIHWKWTDVLNNENCHEFMKQHSLP